MTARMPPPRRRQPGHSSPSAPAPTALMATAPPRARLLTKQRWPAPARLASTQKLSQSQRCLLFFRSARRCRRDRADGNECARHQCSVDPGVIIHLWCRSQIKLNLFDSDSAPRAEYKLKFELAHKTQEATLSAQLQDSTKLLPNLPVIFHFRIWPTLCVRDDQFHPCPKLPINSTHRNSSGDLRPYSRFRPATIRAIA